jgi:hypothetical protein
VLLRHLQTFLARADERIGPGLPAFVRRELYRYLDCGILANGFARVHCATCGRDELVAFSCKGRGFCPGRERLARIPFETIRRIVSMRFAHRGLPLARPPIASERLSLAQDGRVVYALRRHWKDGMRAVVCDPLDFIARLAALVPRPRMHLLTYHGVLA